MEVNNVKVKKAVIPAAGFGTRMLPATKAVPKEMLPILNKPCIQYVVEEAVNSGIEEILIVTHRLKKAIEDHFDRSPELEMHLEHHLKENMLSEVKAISDLVNIQYIRQKTPLGLGHAILCARWFVQDEPFAVLLGDDVIQAQVPVIRQLADQYSQRGTALVGVQPIPRTDVSKCGIVDVDQSSATTEILPIRHIVEKPSQEDAPSNLAVLGRYILPPEIFDILETTSTGHGGELQLTDAIARLALEGKAYALPFKGTHHDIGNLQGWLQANIAFALENKQLQQPICAIYRKITGS